MTTTYFDNYAVQNFLQSSGYRFAATIWFTEKMIGSRERTEYIETADWFKRFFPSNEAQYWFRSLELHVKPQA